MGKDKALISIEDRTMLARAVDFCSLFCDEVLISSDQETHKTEGIRIIEDEWKDCGPMGGIYSCLKASIHSWNFVLSVDTPFVEQEFVHALLKEVNDFDAVVPFHYDKKEPLIALYHKNTLPEIEQLLKTGSYKIHFLLERVNTHFFNAGNYLLKYPRMFHNMNFPEDLKNPE